MSMGRQRRISGGTVLFFLLSLAAASATQAGESVVAPPKVTSPTASLTDPESDIPAWKARWELARVLNYTKRSKDAEAEYRALLKEKPELAEAKLELAATLFWDGHKDEAAPLLAELDPAQLSEDGRALLARLLISQGRPAEAILLLQAYLEKHPDEDALRVKLAEALSWTKAYPEALAQYELLLKKHATDVQLRRRYGMVLMWVGRHAEAAEEFKKTLPETGSR